jgi:hypothetical protein
MAAANLSALDIRAHLSYNPESGEFVRLLANGTAKAGNVAGWQEPSGYRKISILGKKYYAHRCAFLYMTGAWPVYHVDHVNGIRSDNRWSNLRDVTMTVNLQNRQAAPSHSKTGILGVQFHKAANKFAAGIKLPGGRPLHLGLFATAAEAQAAYLSAKRKFHEGCSI